MSKGLLLISFVDRWRNCSWNIRSSEKIEWDFSYNSKKIEKNWKIKIFFWKFRIFFKNFKKIQKNFKNVRKSSCVWWVFFEMDTRERSNFKQVLHNHTVQCQSQYSVGTVWYCLVATKCSKSQQTSGRACEKRIFAYCKNHVRRVMSVHSVCRTVFENFRTWFCWSRAYLWLYWVRTYFLENGSNQCDSSGRSRAPKSIWSCPIHIESFLVYFLFPAAIFPLKCFVEVEVAPSVEETSGDALRLFGTPRRQNAFRGRQFQEMMRDRSGPSTSRDPPFGLFMVEAEEPNQWSGFPLKLFFLREKNSVGFSTVFSLLTRILQVDRIESRDRKNGTRGASGETAGKEFLRPSP